MTKRSVAHATFTIERHYDATPARVFAAFATREAKARWFSGPPEWGPAEGGMDFRVGGRETSRGGPKGGTVHAFDAIYQDIVPNERIVFSYDMHLDETRISVSLTTIEFKPEAGGTRLVFTEQGAFLDGYDDAGGREHGWGEALKQLGCALQQAA
ncbi:polyketide cyclase [Bosea caraganae]|uniref:Polyketide cyclase n=1 Tax=Bosea caraganae TaxID=2763117 RepID=A0A370L8P7_9HYPH|nr:SRPBCC family protein [Bosea caraganae]RDJ26749.1 polyketide cyclase [Bosea caraganae]RDJ30636.1 polyketide cyclase [Bosea caraganae]